MGRKSQLELNTGVVVVTKDTPEPPCTLTEDQADIWSRLFMTLEPDWITLAQYDLAINYCRHADAANKYAAILDQLNEYIQPGVVPADETIKSMDRVSKMIEREVRSLSSIATRLRITNQSIRSDKSKSPAAKLNPWEVTDDLTDEDDEDQDDELEDSDNDESEG